MRRLARGFSVAGWLVIAVIQLTELASAADRKQTMLAARLIESRRVLVIAHRGDSKRAPENTLPAFASAVKAGADLVELDYLHSADGIPVVFHDKELDRTTNAIKIFGRKRIPIGAKTLTELRKLDAGTWFHPRFAGTKIPTLKESLDTIQNGSMTLIEHKGGDAATCIALLKQEQALDRVIVQSFDWKFVADCHRLAPNLVVAALGKRPVTAGKLVEIQKTGARIVVWNHQDIRHQQIREIHDRGLRAWVYTVNDTRRAKQLIADGIDGMITDTPASMLELVKKRK